MRREFDLCVFPVPVTFNLISIYLLTGMTDKEVRYCTWWDVDFHTHVVRVTTKVQWGFKPKNKEEREIPVPASLKAEL